MPYDTSKIIHEKRNELLEELEMLEISQLIDPLESTAHSIEHIKIRIFDLTRKLGELNERNMPKLSKKDQITIIKAISDTINQELLHKSKKED